MEKKVMYVIVRFSKNDGLYIYSRRHSNPQKLVEYKNKLKAERQNWGYEWYIMPEATAWKESCRYREWRKEQDRKIVEHALKKYWFADCDKDKEIREYMEQR